MKLFVNAMWPASSGVILGPGPQVFMTIQNDGVGERLHRLASGDVLPLFDSLFGVALTLLAFSVPDQLMSAMDAERLRLTSLTYLLTGVAIVVYWYKLRRSIEMTRTLLVPQLLLGMVSLLLIVMMPKLAQLVVVYGAGAGDWSNWTPAMVANTAFLAALALFDGICLLYVFSLRRHPYVHERDRTQLSVRLKIQLLGFCVLMSLGFLELASDAFNNEFVLLVPIVLIAEEWLLAKRLKRA